MKVGFIGLGRMGRGMARNALQFGAELSVFDANPDAVQALVDEGATAAHSIGELARTVDVVFTSLPGPAEIESVVLGPDGVAENIRPGAALFDTSTSSHALTLRVHAAVVQRGADMLDAPISGGPEGAASGGLAIWVGGEQAVYDRFLPLLRALGDKTVRVGDVGAGTVVKLVHNLAANMVLVNFAEAFSVAVKAGVEPLTLWEALRLGVVGKQSPLDLLAQRFMLGTFEPPGMTLQLSYKDVRLAAELGRDLGVPMRMTALILEETAEAVAKGYGQMDAHVNTQVQLERAGVKISVDPEALRRSQR